jgi:protein involved in polysaccharide export with SLBB domain
MYEQAMESEKRYDRAVADSLLDLKMNLGYKYPVAINLEEALAHPGEAADMLLRAGDEIVVPQFSNTIKISGEVMYPISINYQKGKGLSYYIKSAGGNSRKASKKQT